MKPLVKKALFRATILLVWVLGGAWLFVLVEYKEEDDRQAKEMIMTELYHNMSTKYNMTMMEFISLAYTIHDALTLPKVQWYYANAVGFALQTVTTIGYGNIVPTTPTGQILCILYVLTGIPISMLALKSVGGLIAEGFTVIIRWVEKRLWKTTEPKHVEIKCAVVTFVSMMLFITIGAIMQVYWEDFTYVEGIYMWIITFTTVGYGDFYPGKSYYTRSLVRNDTTLEYVYETDTSSVLLIETFFLFFNILGLCLVSSVLNSIVSAVDKYCCRTHCHGCLPRVHHINIGKHQNSIKTLDEKLRMEDAQRWSGTFNNLKDDTDIEPKRDALDPTNAKSNMNSERNSTFDVSFL